MEAQSQTIEGDVLKDFSMGSAVGAILEYRRKNQLLEIVSRARKPIEVDHCIENLNKETFARVCVEVDLSKPLVPSIRIASNPPILATI